MNDVISSLKLYNKRGQWQWKLILCNRHYTMLTRSSPDSSVLLWTSDTQMLWTLWRPMSLFARGWFSDRGTDNRLYPPMQHLCHPLYPPSYHPLYPAFLSSCLSSIPVILSIQHSGHPLCPAFRSSSLSSIPVKLSVQHSIHTLYQTLLSRAFSARWCASGGWLAAGVVWPACALLVRSPKLRMCP